MKYILLVLIVLVSACSNHRTINHAKTENRAAAIIDSVIAGNPLNHKKIIIADNNCIRISFTSSEIISDFNLDRNIVEFITYNMLKNNLVNDFDSVVYTIACQDPKGIVMTSITPKANYNRLISIFNNKTLQRITRYAIDSISTAYVVKLEYDLAYLKEIHKSPVTNPKFDNIIQDYSFYCNHGGSDTTKQALNALVTFWDSIGMVKIRHLHFILNACSK